MTYVLLSALAWLLKMICTELVRAALKRAMQGELKSRDAVPGVVQGTVDIQCSNRAGAES